MWYHRYKSDIYPEGVYISPGGIKSSPPKYYDRLYAQEHPDQMRKIIIARKIRASHNMAIDHFNGSSHFVSNTDSFRLPVREAVKQSQINSLKRPLEDL